MSKVLLITGATGRQGGAVIDALLDQAAKDKDGTTTKFDILAVTRNTSSAAAQSLLAKSPNITLVEGNLNNVPALFEKAQRLCEKDGNKKIWGVYSVQTSLGTDVTTDGEIAQGKALIDGAIGAGVSHFVYSSVERGGDDESWAAGTPIPHFQTKLEIERYLRSATEKSAAMMGWTILRPVAFMDNLAPGVQTRVFLAALRNHLGDRDKATQWVATADIGVFAAKAFSDPAAWDRRAVGLAGDELTMEQLGEAFERATGSPAPMANWLLGSVLTYLVKEVRLMIGWFATDGYKADIAARRAEHPGLMNMEEWLVKKSKFVTRRG
ncbi:NAD(P)-binding protein [Echria macrotheca]|uniref:NAD(P)-binding protein n=1 Tax=Echria macrotheca TaxID=438768 RepID=A0AAJ0FFE7_9PEZI|nr:NAD(P)-binding protein [Echria macrotheca]